MSAPLTRQRQVVAGWLRSWTGWEAPAVAALALAAAVPSPLVRAISVTVLFCLAPGWLFSRWLDDADLLMRLVLSVALSLAITTGVSLTLFYLHQWTWQRCFTLLALITMVAAVFGPERRRA
jgi:uncharacterized membrane protein